MHRTTKNDRREAALGRVRYLATLLGAGDQGRAVVVHPRRGTAARPGRGTLAACSHPEAMNCCQGTSSKGTPVLTHQRRRTRRASKVTCIPILPRGAFPRIAASAGGRGFVGCHHT